MLLVSSLTHRFPWHPQYFLNFTQLSSLCSWIQDIEAYTPGSKVDYPIIADPKREIAVL